MTRKMEELAKKLGADVVGTVPDYSAGAFGVAKLARTLRERLEPGQGKRPGRPSNPSWSKRSKVPLAAETEKHLEQLARLLSDEHRKVSPMQVAAQILEEGTAGYFSHAARPIRLEGHGTKDVSEESATHDHAPMSSRFPLLAQSGLQYEVAALRTRIAAMPRRVFPRAA